MSNEGVLVQFPVIVAGDMSADITSSAINIEHLDDIAFEANLTGAGTANGTISIEVSLSHVQDQQGNIVTAGTWNALNLSPNTTIVAGSPSSWYIEISASSAPWMRIKYAKSSGTGTLDAFISGKKI